MSLPELSQEYHHTEYSATSIMDHGHRPPNTSNPAKIPRALRAIKSGARHVLFAYAVRKQPAPETFLAKVIRDTANHKRITKLQEEFFPSETGLRGVQNWQAVRQLGSGGQGMTGLWVQVDPKTRKIMDRMVIKEAQPADVDWQGRHNWLGGKIGGIPREAGIPLLLQLDDSKHARKVVALYTPRLIRARDVLYRVGRSIAGLGRDFVAASSMTAFDPSISLDVGRLAHGLDALSISGAMDTAAGADEAGIASGVSQPGSAATPAPPQPRSIEDDTCIIKVRSYGVQPARMTYRVYMDFLSAGDLCPTIDAYAKRSTTRRAEPIPEPFLWFTLYRLMVACKEMGYVKRLNTLFEASVIHQDIKPANVFLGAQDETHYPHWPRAYLGDFGSARLVSSNNTDTVDDWRVQDFWTAGWMPPEYRDGTEVITPAANVWVCAFVILALMTRDDMNFFLYGPQECEIPPAVERLYSPELIRMIRGCQEIDPKDRAEPQDVLDFIKANEDRLLGGMKDPRAANRKIENHLLPGLIDSHKEKYKEGLHYPPELLDFLKTTGCPHRTVSAGWDPVRKPKPKYRSFGGM